MDGSDGQTWDVSLEDMGDALYIHYEGAFDVPAAQAAAALVAERVHQPGTLWNIISDFRDATIVDAAVVEVLVHAITANAPYVKRAAVIDTRGAIDVITSSANARSGRTNVRLCATLDEAFRWVRTGEP